MTPEQIKQICPTVKNSELFAPIFNEYLDKYDINTVNRKAMFLAQCLHECGGFRFLRELWGPTDWQLRYEGHKGLGNDQPGDGKKYLGRGCIQLTGKYNYKRFSEWLGDPDVLIHPEIVESPTFAVLSAIWFWATNSLNKYADKDDIEGCTKRINGPGMLGLNERKVYYERAKEIFRADID